MLNTVHFDSWQRSLFVPSVSSANTKEKGPLLAGNHSGRVAETWTSSLFISPSILYNFIHSLRRPNLSIFSHFCNPIIKTYSVAWPEPVVWQTNSVNSDHNNSSVSEKNVWITAKLLSFFRELTLRDFENLFAIRWGMWMWWRSRYLLDESQPGDTRRLRSIPPQVTKA